MCAVAFSAGKWSVRCTAQQVLFSVGGNEGGRARVFITVLLHLPGCVRTRRKAYYLAALLKVRAALRGATAGGEGSKGQGATGVQDHGSKGPIKSVFCLVAVQKSN